METFDGFWGAFGGMVLGFIVAKVFETWAMLFNQYGVHNGSYMVGPLTTPLWVQAVHHPAVVTWIVVILYGILGVLFVWYRRSRTSLDATASQD